MDIDDAIDNFISILDFDQVIAWAKLLDVEVNYPPTSEMYPDWENELAVEVGDAMRKIGKDTCNICGEEKNITDLHRSCGK